MILTKNQKYRFGEFELKVSSRSLIRGEKEIALGSKAFEVLVYLLQRSGEVVTKEELFKAVWPESFVEESNLSQHIYALRKALADRSSYIVTVPGRGYQFTAGVESFGAVEDPLSEHAGGVLVQRVVERTHLVIEESQTAVDSQAQTQLLLPGRSSWRRFLPAMAGALAGIALCAAAYWFFLRHSRPTPLRVSSYVQITHDGHEKYLSGTDGSRLYFTQRSPQLGEQVAVSGGTPAPVPIPIPNSWVGDVSPDGSTLLVISEAGGMTSAESLWSAAVLGGSLRHLASAVVATWSPDGEEIAYATQDGSLNIMRSDGSQSRKIASVGGYLSSLSWSPNGDVLRFTKEGKLWQISAKGSNLQELLSGWRNGSARSEGRFGSDGRFFFICDGQIWTMDERRSLLGALRTEPVALTTGPIRWTEPTPSKDGKKIFAVGASRRGELVRFDAQSKKFQPFLGGISAEFVSFSKDGQSLVYVSYPEGILWRTRRDGSVPVQLTSPPVYPKLPRWSPDGKQIVYVDHSSLGVSEIYVLASEGGGAPSRLLPEDHQPETDPNWSPDGSKIVFSTSPEEFTNPQAVLRIVDVDSGKATIVPDSTGLYSPRWSPDGKWIAASTLDSLAIKVFNMETQQWTALHSGPVAFPEWSRDGRAIEYVSWLDDPAVLRIPAAGGGKPEVVADLKGEQYTGYFTSWMGLDPADAPLMLLDRGSKDIYRLTIEEK